MNNAEHEDSGLTSILSRGIRNRRVMIGVTGLAAVLGIGAFLVTDQKTGPSGTTAGPVRPAGRTATATRPTGPASAVPKSENGAASAMIFPHALTKPSTPSVDQRLSDARSGNERLGTEVRHAPPPSTSNVDPSKVTVTQTGSPEEGHYLRVSTSREDLTGYRELAWARDGTKVGDAICTQSITLSPNTPPQVKPTLLLCWRTSAKKSVYTIAVDFKKPPVRDVSVGALDKAWANMR